LIILAERQLIVKI